ncbi:ABC transporter ATP-binding protein yojI [Candidatus Magnetomorum sp. HK-1]|nr:ABC transporter ATP-binding protein yojI [Candidatus Magnetomorum sp. HK-1]
MFKFIFYINNRINKRVFFVISMSALSGIAAASLAAMINEAGEATILASSVDILKMLPFFLFVVVILFFSRRMALRSGVDLVERTLETYRNDIANKLRQSTLMKMEVLDQGEIYTRLSVDTKKIARAYLSSIRGIQSIATIGLIIAYIYSFSFVVGICFTALFTLGIFYYQINYQLLIKSIDEMTHSETKLYDDFGQVLDGFNELKLNADKSEDFFYNHLKPLGKKVKNLRISVGKRYVEVNAFCMVLLFYLTLGSVIFLLPVDYSVALRFKIIAISAFLWEPLEYLKGVIPQILMAEVSINRLKELENQLEFSPRITEFVSPPIKPQQLFQQLKIESLEFKYTDMDGNTTFTVGPIHADINQGETVFLVGGNGSGKSTVLKLISGLYPPYKGLFYLNGMEIDIFQHRHLFSVVYTDCYIFDSLYGIQEVDDQTVYDLLKLMEIDHKVQWKEKKLYHSGLSNGQKKRLAFVIALIEDRPIYILDEWAAEQDTTFKKQFYTELLPLLKKRGKTIIAATHDEQYYHVADRVISMQYGKMVSEDIS